jgi:hypothetical protein
MTANCFERVKDKIEEYSVFREGWDGYKGQPPSLITCCASILLTSVLQDMDLLCPNVWLDSSGDICFNWRLVDMTYIEICVTERSYCYLVVNWMGDPILSGNNLEVTVRDFPRQLIDLLRKEDEN